MRQEVFFREVMDPFVRDLLDAPDPWDAYDAVASMRGAMQDYLEWGPNGGEVFGAWADLEDLYDTGKTPIADAHAALRSAAVDWLARPSEPSVDYLAKWVENANRKVAVLIERDGGFGTPRS